MFLEIPIYDATLTTASFRLKIPFSLNKLIISLFLLETGMLGFDSTFDFASSNADIINSSSLSEKVSATFKLESLGMNLASTSDKGDLYRSLCRAYQ